MQQYILAEGEGVEVILLMVCTDLLRVWLFPDCHSRIQDGIQSCQGTLCYNLRVRCHAGEFKRQ